MCKLAEKPNPNLLDNWYFARPVNQRGQGSYTGVLGVYGIDRWHQQEAALIATVADQYVEFSNINSDGSSFLIQMIENGIRTLPGKTVTFSMLEYGGDFNYFTTEISNPETGLASDIMYTTNYDVYFWKYTETALGLVIGLHPHSAISSVAVKLEIGTQQTLAHQKNGVWILNEIPDYQEQLLKCQCYYRVLQAQQIPGIMYTQNEGVFLVPGFMMRTTPTVLGEDKQIKLRCSDNIERTALCSMQALRQDSSGICLKITANDGGIPDGIAIIADLEIQLSADL